MKIIRALLLRGKREEEARKRAMRVASSKVATERAKQGKILSGAVESKIYQDAVKEALPEARILTDIERRRKKGRGSVVIR